MTDISRSMLAPVFSDIFAKTMFWCFSIALVLAIFDRYKSRFPIVKIGVIVGLGGAALLWFSFVQPDVIMRSIFSASTAGLILMCALPPLWQKRSGMLESIMFGLVAAISATYFLRPIIVYGVMDAAHSTATYQGSAYATLLHATSAICALACGVAMLIVAGHDIIAKQQLAMTIDPLTGLLNRRGLDELVDQEVSNDDGVGNQGSVIIFDLDLFKQVNDRFGHEAGDDVLKRVGSTVMTLISEHGKAARIGGEEFVVILDPLSSEVRVTIANQLRVALGMLVHPELDADCRVTSSFGVAKIHDGESFKMALCRADFALYRAKAEGRDRVVEARPERAKVASKKSA
ncbi:GGDEF domain-containing protein [Parasphingorhabdus sp.]|uniref:GGDEF domain-containing protein n=1 Tax=Parasphingorhabdus sp. TaxID=2709688 RepID=UPI003BAEAF6D